MNRSLPPGDCGDRSSDPGWARGHLGTVPDTGRLVDRVEDPQKRANRWGKPLSGEV